MGANAATGLTIFFSQFIFGLLRESYRDELAMLAVFAATVLWSSMYPVVTVVFGWLNESEDDPRWLEVWAKMLEGINWLLVFLWSQFIVVLLTTDMAIHNTSPALAITFLIVVQLAMVSRSVGASPLPSSRGRGEGDEVMETVMDMGADAIAAL